MKQKLMTTNNMVVDVLTELPETRSSDRALILEIYRKYYGVCHQPWNEVLMRTDLPAFETIRRCRQKVQEEHEELRAAKKVEQQRFDYQKDFIDYAIGM